MTMNRDSMSMVCKASTMDNKDNKNNKDNKDKDHTYNMDNRNMFKDSNNINGVNLKVSTKDTNINTANKVMSKECQPVYIARNKVSMEYKEGNQVRNSPDKASITAAFRANTTLPIKDRANSSKDMV